MDDPSRQVTTSERFHVRLAKEWNAEARAWESRSAPEEVKQAILKAALANGKSSRLSKQFRKTLDKAKELTGRSK